LNDTLHTRVRARAQEEKSHGDQEHIERSAKHTADAAGAPELGAVVDITHAQVCNAPKDEAEEGVEEGGHEGEQVGEERNDFGDDEGEDPGSGKNSSPGDPAYDGL
jgi:hypothetical protein